MDHRFGAVPPWSIGVEEELFLVDAESSATAPVFSRVVPEAGDRIKPEVFECLAELATPVVPDAAAALVELRRLRLELARLAEPHGVRLHAAGAHALAHGEGQPIVPVARYRRMAAKLGPRLGSQLVCGLHVHVAMPDAGTCLTAFEAVVPWLPVLLALSANSPLADGERTGRRSERAERLLVMPTGGTPPVVETWDDWRAATRGDSMRRHWDAWPRPEHGTLEVRVMDMPTDVSRSAGFAAVVRALAMAGAESPAPAYDRRVYGRRRAAAAVEPPVRAEVAALAERIDGVLQGEDRVLAEAVLSGRPEAERQLAVAESDGIAAVPADVVARTLA
ncbi:MAG TPA: YbdK family carboxylate-amine ligase [Gaiellaceae bacterium]|nr:YbdK family carboxylate-amine ligase [Gaiellaceae bacterium]